MGEKFAYQRLRDAMQALGGSLEHHRLNEPQGGTWVLEFGEHRLEMPSSQSKRYPDLDACYRLKDGIPVSRTWEDHTSDIDPVGMAKLFELLARGGRR